MKDVSNFYLYKAVVKSIYDGDTMTVDIDQGFNVWRIGQKIRLYGIDTPELRGEERIEGLMVRDFVRELCPNGTSIILESIKDTSGKYGRWLGKIYLPDMTCLNDLLVEQGMAEVRFY